MATETRDKTLVARSAEEERLIALRKRDSRRQWFWRVAGYVVVLGAWELISPWLLSENLLPGPIRIIETFPDLWNSGRFLQSYGATLTRIGIGFACAFGFGALLGVFTQNRWVDGFFKDGVTISLVSPGLSRADAARMGFAYYDTVEQAVAAGRDRVAVITHAGVTIPLVAPGA